MFRQVSYYGEAYEWPQIYLSIYWKLPWESNARHSLDCTRRPIKKLTRIVSNLLLLIAVFRCEVPSVSLGAFATAIGLWQHNGNCVHTPSLYWLQYSVSREIEIIDVGWRNSTLRWRNQYLGVNFIPKLFIKNTTNIWNGNKCKTKHISTFVITHDIMRQYVRMSLYCYTRRPLHWYEHEMIFQMFNGSNVSSD